MPQKYLREITIYEGVSIHIVETDLIVPTDMVTCSTDNENVVYTRVWKNSRITSNGVGNVSITEL